MLRDSNPLLLGGRRILITGGTGFIGRSLLDYLIESFHFHGQDFTVTVLSRNPDLFYRKYKVYKEFDWIKCIHGSLSDLPAVGDYTDVIHAAANTDLQNENLDWFDQIVGGTKEILRYSVESGASRMLFVSSGAVYGSHSSLIFTEETCKTSPDPLDVSATYAQAKRAAEHLCALYTEKFGIHCVIGRLHSVISQHMPFDGNYAAGNFIRDALDPNSKRIKLVGPPNTIRSYIDGRDMAHWMCFIESFGSAGEAYNIGSDQPISMDALARTVCYTLGVEKEIYYPNAHSVQRRSTYVPSIEKAKGLGLKLQYSLEEAIRRAASGYELGIG